MLDVSVGENLSEGQLSDVTVPPPPSQSSNESVCQSTSSASSYSDHHHHHRDRHGDQQQRSAPCCLVVLSCVRAHQQSINVMRCHGDHVITASNDHTLKVSVSGSSFCSDYLS